MAGDRRALLIASSDYTDPALTKLRAPTGDVRALAEALADDAIGAFEVAQLINRTTDDIQQEIEGFFEDARRDDLLLLYISGHGVLSQRRRFYVATVSTKLKRLRATAIEDRFISDAIEHSRARSTVLVLDCCHSGAFAHGFAPKSAMGINVGEHFEGRGHVVLTASTALEYAFEDAGDETQVNEIDAALPGSLFTRCLVEGLSSGDADRDRDGRVSIDELYDYVYDSVRARSPHQTPGKSGGGHGDIFIARSRHHGAPPPEVRDAIDTALDSPLAAIREAAVVELARLRRTADPAVAVAIEDALRRAVDDDSRRVSAAARAAVRPDDPTEGDPQPESPSPVVAPWLDGGAAITELLAAAAEEVGFRPLDDGPTRTVTTELGDGEITFQTRAEIEDAPGDVVVVWSETLLRCTATGTSNGDGGASSSTISVLRPMRIEGALTAERWTYANSILQEALNLEITHNPGDELELDVLLASLGDAHSFAVLAINGLSAALLRAGISHAPVGAVCIGAREQRLVVNPEAEPVGPTEFDLIVVGTERGELMVEPRRRQAMTEAAFLDALDVAHQQLRRLWAAQRELAGDVAREDGTAKRPGPHEPSPEKRARLLYKSIQAAEPSDIPFLRA